MIQFLPWGNFPLKTAGEKGNHYHCSLKAPFFDFGSLPTSNLDILFNSELLLVLTRKSISDFGLFFISVRKYFQFRLERTTKRI